MLFRRKKNIDDLQTYSSLSDITEFTLLDPRAITNDISTLVNITVKNSYLAVVVNPINVRLCKELISERAKKEIKVVAVVGFPFGASKLEVKVEEAKSAFSDGADEVEVVINIARAKEGDFSYIKTELSRIVRIAKGRTVKAIIETCYLSRDEIKNVTRALVKAKVDYIVTSTGFGTGGATAEDVALIHESAGGKCYVKAAGGIRTKQDADDMIRAGASRIGTSRLIV